MNTLVSAVSSAVPVSCRTNRSSKDRCSFSMDGAPASCVIVDLDCDALELSNRKRCDFLFVGTENVRAWVVPVELKSGGFKVEDVVKQLKGGAIVANSWIPNRCDFDLVPVLVHGKGIHKRDMTRLRAAKIKLRSQTRQVELIRCGQPLRMVLRKS